MSTSPKPGGKNPKNACQAEVRPQFAKLPCPRDQRAYRLMLTGLTQERIAAKLGCSQPTVHRGIGRMEKWMTLLPEDRGEYVASEKLRLALSKHEMLLEHLQRRALRDYRRSQRPVPVEKVVTRKVTRMKGDEQIVTDETRTEKCNKPQRGQVALLSYAGKVSHELTVLAAGYLGPGNGSISMAEVMDPEERDRWDRMVKRREATIDQLEKRVAELEAKHVLGEGLPTPPAGTVLGAGLPTPPAGLTGGLPVASGGDLRSGVSAGSETRAEQGEVLTRSVRSTRSELKPEANGPVVNQVPSLDAVATPMQSAICDQPLDPGGGPSRDLENLNKTPPPPTTLGAGLPTPPTGGTAGLRGTRGGDLRSGVSAGSETRAEPTPSEPDYDESVEFCETRTPKWNCKYRQEALDLHCRIHGIPPLEPHQVVGLPDPMRISPKLAIERGYPYILHCDRSIPSKREPVRDTRKVITVSEW